MKRFLIAATIATASVSTPVLAADVGVSISIGQPGFYGRLDIGDFPQPRVIYAQPVMIERVPMERPPIYLRVPPGHQKHWKKHCHEYNACGERVFFVQDNWYSHEYAPRYQEQHRNRGEDHRDERKDDRREHRDDHREKQKEERQGDDHERGRDH
jgi:hypothetical protein